MQYAEVEALRAGGDGGQTCAHYAANNGNLPMLQWIVEVAGIETLRSAGDADGDGRTPVMIAAREGRLDVVKWIVSRLGLDCLRTTSNRDGADIGETAVFYACVMGWPAVVEYIFDVLGGEALRVSDEDGETPLQVLEAYLGPFTAHFTVNHISTVAQVNMLLTVPEKLPALVQAQRRLALAKATSPRLGAASAAAAGDMEVLQKIMTEVGVQRTAGALVQRTSMLRVDGRFASHEDVRVWLDEMRESDSQLQ